MFTTKNVKPCQTKTYKHIQYNLVYLEELGPGLIRDNRNPGCKEKNVIIEKNPSIVKTTILLFKAILNTSYTKLYKIINNLACTKLEKPKLDRATSVWQATWTVPRVLRNHRTVINVEWSVSAVMNVEAKGSISVCCGCDGQQQCCEGWGQSNHPFEIAINDWPLVPVNYSHVCVFFPGT